MFNTYIEDKAMIPVLLGYDWMIMKDTWTDCPLRNIHSSQEESHT